jgi:hypothetical protein
MKKLGGPLGLGLMLMAGTAAAHEYPLQFTPNSGYRGLVVAGYQFVGNTIVGNCSYYTVRSGSGRGGGYHTTTTHYDQTCTWDSYGNLLNITQGAPAVPAPLYVSGTQTVYAMDSNGDTTGTDTALASRGFVNTLGSHYTWLTSNAYLVLQQMPYTFTATLASDGDLPLNISAAEVSVLKGKATVNGTTCIGQIAPGATCTVTVTYDPTKLRSATGLAYDTLTLGVTSDAGQASDFIQSYTIVVKKPIDDND